MIRPFKSQRRNWKLLILTFLQSSILPSLIDGTCNGATDIYYSTWGELAAAVQSTRWNLLDCPEGTQVIYKIQSNSILDATELPQSASPTRSPTISPSLPPTLTPSMRVTSRPTTSPVSSTSRPTSTSSKNIPIVSPLPTIITSLSYDYGESRVRRRSENAEPTPTKRYHYSLNENKNTRALINPPNLHDDVISSIASSINEGTKQHLKTNPYSMLTMSPSRTTEDDIIASKAQMINDAADKQYSSLKSSNISPSPIIQNDDDDIISSTSKVINDAAKQITEPQLLDDDAISSTTKMINDAVYKQQQNTKSYSSSPTLTSQIVYDDIISSTAKRINDAAKMQQKIKPVTFSPTSRPQILDDDLISSTAKIINKATNSQKTNVMPSKIPLATIPVSPATDDNVISSTAITIDPYNMIMPSSHNADNEETPSKVAIFTIVIQCGNVGNINDNCIIVGGDSHFIVDVTLPPTNDRDKQLFFMNTQILVHFRGLIMKAAQDTSILIYHSSGDLLIPQDNAAAATLHNVNVTFDDCYWKRNIGVYGAAVDVYKNSIDTANNVEVKSLAMQQLLVTFERCAFADNFSEKGGAILIENTDNSNSFIDVSNSMFLNSSESGAIRVTLQHSEYSNSSFSKLNQPASGFSNGVNIANSCFIGNKNIISPGTIYIEYDSTTQSALLHTINNNYGKINSVDHSIATSTTANCTDIYLVATFRNKTDLSLNKGECLYFDSSSSIESCDLLNGLPSEAPTPSFTPTQSPVEQSCRDGSTGYSSWIALSVSIERSPGNETFTLCPNTVLNPQEFVTDDSQILLYTAINIINKSNITVRCGSSGRSDQNCIIRTGESHFWLKGKVNDVNFRGITFQQAAQTSILGYANFGSDASFFDCIWDSNEGEYGAAINIWHELDEVRMEISLYNCTFSNNTSIASAIYNEAGSLIVNKCDFSGNSYGAIRTSKKGVLSLTESCFEDNVFYNATVTIDKTSVLQFNFENYGNNNFPLATTEVNSTCTDIFWESNGCLLFDAASCAAFSPIQPPTVSPAPTSSTSPTSNLCYSNWTSLQAAIQSSTEDSASLAVRSYTICPNAVLQLGTNDTELVITRSNTHISCNNCTVSGGEIQISIQMSPINVEFRGITFYGAQSGSVMAYGKNEASALFVNCTFESGNAPVIVKMYYQFAPQSMSLTFIGCKFLRNSAFTALIQNQGGALVVKDSVMNNNEAGNMITVTDPGSLSLTRTCFEENSSVRFGTIQLFNGTTLLANLDNYGQNNSISFSSTPCDIFLGVNNSCVVFDSLKCMASTN